MPDKQILINIVLLLIIIGLGVLVVTSHYTPPQSPVGNLIKKNESIADSETTPTMTNSETVYEVAVKRDIFPHFGERDIFKTILPKPTPVPRPTRTPQPDPPIAVLTRNWKLTGILGDKALFNDRGTREDFFLKEGESRTVNYRGKDYPITLSEINRLEFSVTLSYKDQKRTLKMF